MKEKTSGQKMLLTAGFMAMATLLSKVLGLVRDSLLTAYFGSGLESDAFLTASTIPTTLFDVIIGGVISAAFIPVFNDIMSKKGKDEAMKFVNKFVTLIVCITLFIVVGGIIFRDVLVNIQAPNYTADKHTQGTAYRDNVPDGNILRDWRFRLSDCCSHSASIIFRQ